LQSLISLFLAFTMVLPAFASERRTVFEPFLGYFEYQLKKLEQVDFNEYISLRLSEKQREEYKDFLDGKSFKIETRREGESFHIDILQKTSKVISFVVHPLEKTFKVKSSSETTYKSYDLENPHLLQTILNDRKVTSFSPFDLLFPKAHALVDFGPTLLVAIVLGIGIELMALAVQSLYTSGVVMWRLFREAKLGGEFCCGVADRFKKNISTINNEVNSELLRCNKRIETMLTDLKPAKDSASSYEQFSMNFFKADQLSLAWWKKNITDSFSKAIPDGTEEKLASYASDLIGTCENDKSKMDNTTVKWSSVFFGGYQDIELSRVIHNNPKCVTKFKKIKPKLSKSTEAFKASKQCNTDLDELYTLYRNNARELSQNVNINNTQRETKYKESLNQYESKIKSLLNQKAGHQ
jgi:hypothetical protein